MPKGKKHQRTASPTPPPLLPPPVENHPPPPLHLTPSLNYAHHWDLTVKTLREAGIGWTGVLASLWKLRAKSDHAPTYGSILAVRFDEDGVLAYGGEPDAPRPTWLATSLPPPTLGFSPIVTIDTEPEEPAPAPPQLGLSPIENIDTPPEDPKPETPGLQYYELLSEEPLPEAVAPKTPTKTRKRKGRQPSPQEPYQEKRQLNDKEAKKIATSPPVNTVAPPAAPTRSPTPEPTPKDPQPRRPKTATPRPKNNRQPPTTKHGIVIHGVALRRDLEKVRRWLETDNKELGKTTGIRWLRKKTILMEEEKKTSSVVVLYLETPKVAGKVRLGGRWLRTEIYEPNRGRK